MTEKAYTYYTQVPSSHEIKLFMCRDGERVRVLLCAARASCCSDGLTVYSRLTSLNSPRAHETTVSTQQHTAECVPSVIMGVPGGEGASAMVYAATLS